MKRLAAILFLAVVLFNFYGYQLLIDYFQKQQESKLEKELDNNKYDDQDLVFIKLPVNLPYYNYTNSKNYERVNGSIEVNGIEYKYVKRRVYNDTIELACLPNTQKQQFKSVRDDFFKLNNDWQTTHSGKKGMPAFKNFTLDFCNKLCLFSLPHLNEDIKRPIVTNSILLPFYYCSVNGQPPEISLA